MLSFLNFCCAEKLLSDILPRQTPHLKCKEKRGHRPRVETVSLMDNLPCLLRSARGKR